MTQNERPVWLSFYRTVLKSSFWNMFLIICETKISLETWNVLYLLLAFFNMFFKTNFNAWWFYTSLYDDFLKYSSTRTILRCYLRTYNFLFIKIKTENCFWSSNKFSWFFVQIKENCSQTGLFYAWLTNMSHVL